MPSRYTSYIQRRRTADLGNLLFARALRRWRDHDFGLHLGLHLLGEAQCLEFRCPIQGGCLLSYVVSHRSAAFVGLRDLSRQQSRLARLRFVSDLNGVMPLIWGHTAPNVRGARCGLSRKSFKTPDTGLGTLPENASTLRVSSTARPEPQVCLRIWRRGYRRLSTGSRPGSAAHHFFRAALEITSAMRSWTRLSKNGSSRL